MLNMLTISIIENIIEEAHCDGFPNKILYPVLKQSENWNDMHKGDNMQYPHARSHILHMLESYSDIVMDIPGGPRQYNKCFL